MEKLNNFLKQNRKQRDFKKGVELLKRFKDLLRKGHIEFLEKQIGKPSDLADGFLEARINDVMRKLKSRPILSELAEEKEKSEEKNITEEITGLIAVHEKKRKLIKKGANDDKKK